MNLRPLEDIEEKYKEIWNIEQSTDLFFESLTLEDKILYNSMMDLEDQGSPDYNERIVQNIVARNNIADLWIYALGTSKYLVPLVLQGIDKSCVVLDAGCNVGINTVTYALNMPHSHFEGVDFSNENIRIAIQNALAYGVQNAEFYVSDLFDWIRLEKYDVVVATQVIQEVKKDKERLISNFRKNLRKDGRLIFSLWFEYSELETMLGHYSEILCRAGFQPLGYMTITPNSLFDSRKLIYAEALAI